MGDAQPVVKPGYKSTEFWLALVAVLAGFALASGAVVEGSTAATVVGGILSLLAGLGYTKGRTSLKVAEEARLANESRVAGYVTVAAGKIEEYRAGRAKGEAELVAEKLEAELEAAKLEAAKLEAAKLEAAKLEVNAARVDAAAAGVTPTGG